MRILRGLSDDQRGAVAIMTILMAPVLLGCAGLAVDVGFAMSGQTILVSQADAAALAGARAQSWYGGALGASALAKVVGHAADGAANEGGAPGVEGVTSAGQEIEVRLSARVPRFLVSVGDGVIGAAAGARWYEGNGAAGVALER